MALEGQIVLHITMRMRRFLNGDAVFWALPEL